MATNDFNETIKENFTEVTNTFITLLSKTTHLIRVSIDYVDDKLFKLKQKVTDDDNNTTDA